jgi:hypothetical protein
MSSGPVDALWKEVPRVLNTISVFETAAEARAPFAMGAALPSGVQTAQLSCTGAMHPRAFWAADVIERSRMAAQLNVALGQRNSGKQYPHTTRVAAKSGDAEGPHTAREPV